MVDGKLCRDVDRSYEEAGLLKKITLFHPLFTLNIAELIRDNGLAYVKQKYKNIISKRYINKLKWRRFSFNLLTLNKIAWYMFKNKDVRFIQAMEYLVDFSDDKFYEESGVTYHKIKQKLKTRPIEVEQGDEE
jgi:hypothetical protein